MLRCICSSPLSALKVPSVSATLTLSMVVISLVNAAFAQVSKDKQDWARSGIQFLMTKEEKADWAKLKTDADADKFIRLFWLRRDPSPGPDA